MSDGTTSRWDVEPSPPTTNRWDVEPSPPTTNRWDVEPSPPAAPSSPQTQPASPVTPPPLGTEAPILEAPQPGIPIGQGEPGLQAPGVSPAPQDGMRLRRYVKSTGPQKLSDLAPGDPGYGVLSRGPVPPMAEPQESRVAEPQAPPTSLTAAAVQLARKDQAERAQVRTSMEVEVARDDAEKRRQAHERGLAEAERQENLERIEAEREPDLLDKASDYAQAIPGLVASHAPEALVGGLPAVAASIGLDVASSQAIQAFKATDTYERLARRMPWVERVFTEEDGTTTASRGVAIAFETLGERFTEELEEDPAHQARTSVAFGLAAAGGLVGASMTMPGVVQRVAGSAFQAISPVKYSSIHQIAEAHANNERLSSFSSSRAADHYAEWGELGKVVGTKIATAALDAYTSISGTPVSLPGIDYEQGRETFGVVLERDDAGRSVMTPDGRVKSAVLAVDPESRMGEIMRRSGEKRHFFQAVENAWMGYWHGNNIDDAMRRARETFLEGEQFAHLSLLEQWQQGYRGGNASWIDHITGHMTISGTLPNESFRTTEETPEEGNFPDPTMGVDAFRFILGEVARTWFPENMEQTINNTAAEIVNLASFTASVPALLGWMASDKTSPEAVVNFTVDFVGNMAHSAVRTWDMVLDPERGLGAVGEEGLLKTFGDVSLPLFGTYLGTRKLASMSLETARARIDPGGRGRNAAEQVIQDHYQGVPPERAAPVERYGGPERRAAARQDRLPGRVGEALGILTEVFRGRKARVGPEPAGPFPSERLARLKDDLASVEARLESLPPEYIYVDEPAPTTAPTERGLRAELKAQKSQLALDIQQLEGSVVRLGEPPEVAARRVVETAKQIGLEQRRRDTLTESKAYEESQGRIDELRRDLEHTLDAIVTVPGAEGTLIRGTLFDRVEPATVRVPIERAGDAGAAGLDRIISQIPEGVKDAVRAIPIREAIGAIDARLKVVDAAIRHTEWVLTHLKGVRATAASRELVRYRSQQATLRLARDLEVKIEVKHHAALSIEEMVNGPLSPDVIPGLAPEFRSLAVEAALELNKYVLERLTEGAPARERIQAYVGRALERGARIWGELNEGPTRAAQEAGRMTPSDVTTQGGTHPVVRDAMVAAHRFDMTAYMLRTLKSALTRERSGTHGTPDPGKITNLQIFIDEAAEGLARSFNELRDSVFTRSEQKRGAEGGNYRPEIQAYIAERALAERGGLPKFDQGQPKTPGSPILAIDDAIAGRNMRGLRESATEAAKSRYLDNIQRLRESFAERFNLPEEVAQAIYDAAPTSTKGIKPAVENTMKAHQAAESMRLKGARRSLVPEANRLRDLRAKVEQQVTHVPDGHVANPRADRATRGLAKSALYLEEISEAMGKLSEVAGLGYFNALRTVSALKNVIMESVIQAHPRQEARMRALFQKREGAVFELAALWDGWAQLKELELTQTLKDMPASAKPTVIQAMYWDQMGETFNMSKYVERDASGVSVEFRAKEGVELTQSQQAWVDTANEHSAFIDLVRESTQESILADLLILDRERAPLAKVYGEPGSETATQAQGLAWLRRRGIDTNVQRRIGATGLDVVWGPNVHIPRDMIASHRKRYREYIREQHPELNARQIEDQLNVYERDIREDRKVTSPPATGAVSGAHLKRRTQADVPWEERVDRGMTDNLDAIAFRALRQQYHDISRARLFQDLYRPFSETGRVTERHISEVPRDGWRPRENPVISETRDIRKYPGLPEKFFSSPELSAWIDSAEWFQSHYQGTFARGSRAFTNWFKRAHTIGSTTTQVTNFTGNGLFLSALNGISIMNPSNWDSYGRAIEAYLPGARLTDRFRQFVRYGGEGVGGRRGFGRAEIDTAARSGAQVSDLVKGAQGSMARFLSSARSHKGGIPGALMDSASLLMRADTPPPAGAIASWAKASFKSMSVEAASGMVGLMKAAGRKMESAYMAGDNIYRYALFDKLVTEGVHPRTAAQTARKAFGKYEELAGIFRIISTSLIGRPFLAFALTAGPWAMKMIASNPMRFKMMQHLFQQIAFNNMNEANISSEEASDTIRQLPPWRRHSVPIGALTTDSSVFGRAWRGATGSASLVRGDTGGVALTNISKYTILGGFEPRPGESPTEWVFRQAASSNPAYTLSTAAAGVRHFPVIDKMWDLGASDEEKRESWVRILGTTLLPPRLFLPEIARLIGLSDERISQLPMGYGDRRIVDSAAFGDRTRYGELTPEAYWKAFFHATIGVKHEAPAPVGREPWTIGYHQGEPGIQRPNVAHVDPLTGGEGRSSQGRPINAFSVAIRGEVNAIKASLKKWVDEAVTGHEVSYEDFSGGMEQRYKTLFSTLSRIPGGLAPAEIERLVGAWVESGSRVAWEDVMARRNLRIAAEKELSDKMIMDERNRRRRQPVNQ